MQEEVSLNQEECDFEDLDAMSHIESEGKENPMVEYAATHQMQN